MTITYKEYRQIGATKVSNLMERWVKIIRGSLIAKEIQNTYEKNAQAH